MRYILQVCSSYPRAVVVPASITDDMLQASAGFRKGGRFPVLSYRHTSGVCNFSQLASATWFDFTFINQ